NSTAGHAQYLGGIGGGFIAFDLTDGYTRMSIEVNSTASQVGGVVGDSDSYLTRVFAVTPFSGSGSRSAISGTTYFTASNVFWNQTVMGALNVAGNNGTYTGVTARTTTQMGDMVTYN